MRFSISKIKSPMLKKSTIFNFLQFSQLIRNVLASNFFKLASYMHIYLYKNSKIQFFHQKKFFFLIFFFISLKFESQFTLIAANYRKFPYKWVLLSTKMIQKWCFFAYTVLYKKKWTKNWQIPPLCNVSNCERFVILEITKAKHTIQ